MTAPIPLRRGQLAIAEASVGISSLLVLAVLLQSPNAVGHKAKAVLLLVAGAVFFLLALAQLRGSRGSAAERPAHTLFDGLVLFCLFACVATLTLTLDFAIPFERWVGLTAQVGVAVVGVVACVRRMRSG